MKTKTVWVTLHSKKTVVKELKPGEEPPETIIKTYRIELPNDDYDRLKTEAEKENKTIERIIESKYKHADSLPENWKVSD